MDDHALSEADIIKTAAAYMGKPALQTALLAVAAIVLYACLFFFAASSTFGLFVSFVLCSYLVYVIYTPLHEAVHKNISGKNRSLVWLNDAVGYASASLLGVSYTMHRAAHMAHHQATNTEGKDPDLVTTGSSMSDILTCGSKMVMSEYHDYFSRVFPRASNSEKAIVVLEITVFIGWRVALCFAGYMQEVIVLGLLANLVGVTLLGYIFAWIVHTPFNQTARYRNTATILMPAAIHKPLTGLWLWQNYHSIHHLFPRVPFYLYAKLFDEIRSGMEERGAPIREIGRFARA